MRTGVESLGKLLSIPMVPGRPRSPARFGFGVALVTALALTACQTTPGSPSTVAPPSVTRSPTPTASAEPTPSLAPTATASPVADPPCAFGTPMNLGPGINTPGFDGGPTPSSDGLRLYFVSDRTGSAGGDIWVAERSSVDAEFSPPVNVGPGVNSAANEGSPTLSSDELVLLFDRDDGTVWAATRPSIDEPFGLAAQLSEPVNAPFAGFPGLSVDGLTLYFADARPGGSGDMDVWQATRRDPTEPFEDVENLALVNTASADAMATVSANDLTLIFASTREGGMGDWDMWIATRSDVGSPFATPLHRGGNANPAGFEGRPHLTSDGSMLLFMSDRPGGQGAIDLWQAAIDCTGI